MFRVQFQPNAQLLNANCPDLRQLVPVTVHKHTTKHTIHHGGHLLFVLMQLQDKHMENAYRRPKTSAYWSVGYWIRLVYIDLNIWHWHFITLHCCMLLMENTHFSHYNLRFLSLTENLYQVPSIKGPSIPYPTYVGENYFVKQACREWRGSSSVIMFLSDSVCSTNLENCSLSNFTLPCNYFLIPGY